MQGNKVNLQVFKIVFFFFSSPKTQVFNENSVAKPALRPWSHLVLCCQYILMVCYYALPFILLTSPRPFLSSSHPYVSACWYFAHQPIIPVYGLRLMGTKLASGFISTLILSISCSNFQSILQHTYSHNNKLITSHNAINMTCNKFYNYFDVYLFSIFKQWCDVLKHPADTNTDSSNNDYCACFFVHTCI